MTSLLQLQKLLAVKLQWGCIFIRRNQLVKEREGEAFMILDLTVPKNRILPRRLPWKQEIRRSIYAKNQQAINQRMKGENKEEEKLRSAAERVLFLFLDQGVEEMRGKDNSTLATCHSYYSFFLPLSIQVRLESQLSLALPCLRKLEETGRLQERQLLMLEISQHMRESAERGEADRGWLRCLRKYVCELDSLRALEAYLQIKKRGGTRSNMELYKQFGGECMPRIFFQRIDECKEYLRERAYKVSLELSVEEGRDVDEVSMPLTMKNLFCWICFLYDCGQHNLEDSIRERQYHFVAPGNLLPQHEQINKALTLYAQYQYLIRQGTIPKSNSYPCSSKCYRYLTKASWEELQTRRGTLLSPIVKGAIKMGIHMYSYSPCQLWFLLADRGVTCSLVFLFLLQDLNLAARLENKLQVSQVESLMRIGKDEGEQRCGTRQRGRPRVRLAHREHTWQVTPCAHHFLGQGVVDRGCEGCGCRKRNFCIPQCLCDEKCPLRKRGCHCRKDDCRTDKCPCRKNNEECDPMLCGNCFSRTDCKNHQVLEGRGKKVRVGRSTIGAAGLGLFAREAVKQGELLGVYSGQLIDDSVDILREHLSVDSTFYNFSSRQGTIDARFRGNITRFINHDDQGRENLYAQDVLSGGRFKVALFAKRDIEPHQQLFFDYDGEGKLFEFYKEKYPFIHKKKNRTK